jgi:uncharacterized membrane protein
VGGPNKDTENATTGTGNLTSQWYIERGLDTDGKSGEVSGTLVIHNERFAKGEIDKAEYEERRTMLLS